MVKQKALTLGDVKKYVEDRLDCIDYKAIVEDIMHKAQPCKSCSLPMKVIGKDSWEVKVGITTYYFCNKCNLTMRQYENFPKDKTWVNI